MCKPRFTLLEAEALLLGSRGIEAEIDGLVIWMRDEEPVAIGSPETLTVNETEKHVETIFTGREAEKLFETAGIAENQDESEDDQLVC